MTVLERVRNLVVRLSPDPICDDCITERLNLSVRQHELMTEPGFERRVDACTLCGCQKKVICYS